jgi:hypothetical protein
MDQMLHCLLGPADICGCILDRKESRLCTPAVVAFDLWNEAGRNLHGQGCHETLVKHQLTLSGANRSALLDGHPDARSKGADVAAETHAAEAEVDPKSHTLLYGILRIPAKLLCEPLH